MANAAGFTRHQIESRRGTEWQVLRRGTYAYAGVTPSPVMRAAAAVLAGGGQLRPGGPDRPDIAADSAGATAAEVDRVDRAHGDRRRESVATASAASRGASPVAVAAGRTAARVWGIPLVDDEDPAMQRFEAEHDDIIRSRGRSSGRTLHSRRVQLHPDDVVHVMGVPVLTPLRAVADLAVVLRPDALVAAIDHALHVELVELTRLEAVASGHRRGEHGALALRAALALADMRAESPHESLTRLVVKPVLPGLRSQVRVFDRSGRLVARLDLGDDDLRLGVESDGAAYHRGRATQDRRRDARTGWTIERVSWFETRCEQDELRQRVLATAANLGDQAA
ncbi:MAG: hypothetical protein JWP11_3538 [Frankiales bacterium]|nr:hypothetical protein [Frankiales bacterium]